MQQKDGVKREAAPVEELVGAFRGPHGQGPVPLELVEIHLTASEVVEVESHLDRVHEDQCLSVRPVRELPPVHLIGGRAAGR
jgi:hypothetical protein